MDIDFVRIGEKLININKIDGTVRRILTLRSQGYSQSEVSKITKVDRTFVSRIEGIGEVRKGGRVAVIGFPIENKQELMDICHQYGVEYTLLMTDYERWEWLRQNTGDEMINNIMEMASEVRAHDIVVVLGSNYRINLIKALLNKEVIGIEIGKSPIKGNVYVSPEEFHTVICEFL